jgi:hypothetical protein
MLLSYDSDMINNVEIILTLDPSPTIQKFGEIVKYKILYCNFT